MHTKVFFNLKKINLDHQVNVGNGNHGTVQFNCNGVGRCNSGSAPTRNCDYRVGSERYTGKNNKNFSERLHF